METDINIPDWVVAVIAGFGTVQVLALTYFGIWMTWTWKK
jgi:hypothetical protein